MFQSPARHADLFRKPRALPARLAMTRAVVDPAAKASRDCERPASSPAVPGSPGPASVNPRSVIGYQVPEDSAMSGEPAPRPGPWLAPPGCLPRACRGERCRLRRDRRDRRDRGAGVVPAVATAVIPAVATAVIPAVATAVVPAVAAAVVTVLPEPVAVAVGAGRGR